MPKKIKNGNIRLMKYLDSAIFICKEGFIAIPKKINQDDLKIGKLSYSKPSWTQGFCHEYTPYCNNYQTLKSEIEQDSYYLNTLVLPSNISGVIEKNVYVDEDGQTTHNFTNALEITCANGYSTAGNKSAIKCTDKRKFEIINECVPGLSKTSKFLRQLSL